MSDTLTLINEFLSQGQQQVSSVAQVGRVAARLLPKYQLAPTAKQVVLERNQHAGGVNDVTTIPLAEIWQRFTVDWQQLSDPSLRTALELARSAAQNYSVLEDRLLFLGQSRNAGQLVLNPPDRPLRPIEQRVDRGFVNDGLMAAPPVDGDWQHIYESVAAARDGLVDIGIAGPFGIVMGRELADQADVTPAGFQESPRKRIENLLGRSILISTGTATARRHSAWRSSPIPDRRFGPRWWPTQWSRRSRRCHRARPPISREHRQPRTDEFWVMGGLALRLKDLWGVVRIVF